jgi:hypothetical protein
MSKYHHVRLVAAIKRYTRCPAVGFINPVPLFSKKHFQAFQDRMFVVDDQDFVHGSL